LSNQLKELLENAQGYSDNIIAVFIDVRGFSSFSKTHDSAAVAIFVKHIYLEIIDKYFPAATFYKPTGDGLLVVIACTSNVKEVVVKTIETCQKIVDEFKNFCEDEQLLVTSSVPDKVGIGVARGTAHKIQSGNEIVDYSGATLNLAARLMDVARPTGVVLDSSVITKIKDLPNPFLKSFTKDMGFLRGVAETEPVTVYYDKQRTTIPESFHIPIGSVWKSSTCETNLKELIGLSDTSTPNTLSIRLDREPTDTSQIRVRARWKRVRGGGRFTTSSEIHSFHYDLIDEGHIIDIDTKLLIALLKEANLGPKETITVVVRYPARASRAVKVQ